MGIEKRYLIIMEEILNDGEDRIVHGNIPIKSLWQRQLRHDFKDGFPLLTTKRMSLKNILTELLWFVKGPYNVEYLHEHGCHIWDEWANDDGSIHLGYRRWRNWGNVDQLQKAIDTIKTDPTNRRILVSSWDGSEIDQLSLPPCHVMYHFYCHDDGGLSIFVYQRSADWFLGVPYNIASYSALLMMVCAVTGRYPKTITYQFGDVHLYENQFKMALVQMRREPKKLPILLVHEKEHIDDFDHDDFELLDYHSWSALRVPVVKV